MFRFSIRLVLIAFVSSAPSLPAQERRADLSLADSWWVVSDCYYGGKVEREQVGMVVGFWKGKAYIADADAAEEYEVKFFKGDAGTKFEFFAAGKIVGKGLAVKDGDDILRMYLNHDLRGGGKIDDAPPDKKKCDEFYICLAFKPEDGKARLARHGIDLDKK